MSQSLHACGVKREIRSSELLEINSPQFGLIQVEEDKIINMHSGMLGLSENKRYIIIEREDIQPFYCYQCIDTPAISFTIMNPYFFIPDYAPDIRPVMRQMGWDDDQKGSIKIYVVVNTSKRPPEKITANLMGPLVINTLCQEAVQMVIHNSQYSHEHLIFDSLK